MRVIESNYDVGEFPNQVPISLCPMYHGPDVKNLKWELYAPCHWGFRHKDTSKECYNLLKPYSSTEVTEYADTILNHSFLSPYAELVTTRFTNVEEGPPVDVLTGALIKPEDNKMSHKGFWAAANALFRQEWEFKWLADGFYRILDSGVDRQTAMLVSPFYKSGTWNNDHYGHAAIYTNRASAAAFGAIFELGPSVVTTEVRDKRGECLLLGQTLDNMSTAFSSSCGPNIITNLVRFVRKRGRNTRTKYYFPYKFVSPNEKPKMLDSEAFKDWCVEQFYKHSDTSSYEEKAA